MALLNTASGSPLCRWRRWLLAAAFLLAGVARGQAPGPPSEYQLKAVFLFNFAQFVTWPPDAFDDQNAPLIIGILGQDPFGSSLEATVRNETVDSRKLVVIRYKRVEEVGPCHILFISQSESRRIEEIVGALHDRSILTVADFAGAALRGVMIRFVTEKNRIRLRVNLESAKAARLTLSSMLLRPAEIVTTERK